MSGITVYFPDKIRMNNIMETNWGKNIYSFLEQTIRDL